MLISLFCGPGGLDEGFRRAGFSTVYATDIDQAAVDSHNANHWERDRRLYPDLDEIAVRDDITTLDVPQLIATVETRMAQRGLGDEHPVGIIGGPPCQSFSYGNTNQFDEDPRHNLPTRYAEVIKGVRDHGWLDFFLFENVPALKGLHKDKFERFKQQFDEAGFTIYEGLLEAWQFGVPQLRPRIFIVGIRKDHPNAEGFVFPRPLISDKSGARTVKWAIEDLYDRNPVYFRRGITEEDVKSESGMFNHWCMNPMSPKFKDGTFAKSGKVGKSFAVLDWNQPSLTVAYGHREVHIHPDGTRRLTVREAMRLQGFPDDYKLRGTLSDQIRLVSEVVAPPVAFHVAQAIGAHLGLDLGSDPDERWKVPSAAAATD